MEFHLIGISGKKYLKYFLVILFFSGYFSTGCAHKSVNDSRSANTDPPKHQNREMATTKAEIPSEQELEDVPDEDFMDCEEFFSKHNHPRTAGQLHPSMERSGGTD
jgi:hypothetical protein